MGIKATLKAHLEEHHATPFSKLSSRDRMTLRELQFWHSIQHHRYHTNHNHGFTLGPNDRPDGWLTGLDAQENT